MLLGGGLDIGGGWRGEGHWRALRTRRWDDGVFVRVVRMGGGWAGWGGSALAGGKDELLGGVAGGLAEEHVAAGAGEEGGEDGGGLGWSVGSVDALVLDAAGDLEAGLAGDVAEDLVEAGVVCDDGELAGGPGDGGSAGCGRGGWLVGRSGSGLGRGGRGRWKGGRVRGGSLGCGGQGKGECEEQAGWDEARHLVAMVLGSRLRAWRKVGRAGGRVRLR